LIIVYSTVYSLSPLVIVIVFVSWAFEGVVIYTPQTFFPASPRASTSETHRPQTAPRPSVYMDKECVNQIRGGANQGHR
jgi:hypothetical protein